ncbi:UMP kinase [Candidatus Acetothermia bacterium]|jgi:uridylate kinase|nr:UMP kinase [Candidatus Acetothermia bacterium]MCI2427193.1 UMP kinase [Candidatus Acetothermia bacterium]MCI2427947.1 UMP kinase [Candidatus Acetothermia bacterium]
MRSTLTEQPRRILLKLSGEVLKGEEAPLAAPAIEYITREITRLEKIELAIVLGGGNIIRGKTITWMAQADADSMGMLATVINAMALRSSLERQGREVVIQSALVTPLTEKISYRAAQIALAEGKIILFAGGTGNPFVTTDTAAALHGIGINATLLAKGSKVNGVFTSDPAIDEQAQYIPHLTHAEFISNCYRVMDLTAVQLCYEHDLEIVIFNIFQPDALAAVSAGKPIGTRIT